ncbi:MAG TPA: DUF6763 family protein [Candidatus Acidoferrales bacterium]|nr:DUF6763 family protein [Candidatus Acidoferrales bacterium]
MGELDPVVGQWYLDLEQDDRFRILSMDEQADEIEIEYEDGETRTVGFDEWYDLDLDIMDEDDSEVDEAEEPKSDFYRPTHTRRYREEDDEDDDIEDLDEEDDDWEDR